MELVALANIRRDGGTQTRAALSETDIADYAQLAREGSEFPPVVVFHDGTSYWLADGFHRCAAAERAGHTEIAAAVKQGDKRAAVLYSAGANALHGVRRTNADKRRAVETLFRDEEWRARSDRWIADACKVNNHLVRECRKEMGELPTETDRQTRDGKTYPATKERKMPEPKRERQSESGEEPDSAPQWPDSPKSRSRESAERRERIGMLYREGKSTTEIARELGIDASGVSFHLDALGLRTAETRAGEQVKKIVSTIVGIAFSIDSLPPYRLDREEAAALASSLKQAKESISKLEKKLEKMS